MHEIIYLNFISSARIHINSMNGHAGVAGLLLATKFATITNFTVQIKPHVSLP
jgi:hypothetical protein